MKTLKKSKSINKKGLINQKYQNNFNDFSEKSEKYNKMDLLSITSNKLIDTSNSNLSIKKQVSKEKQDFTQFSSSNSNEKNTDNNENNDHDFSFNNAARKKISVIQEENENDVSKKISINEISVKNIKKKDNKSLENKSISKILDNEKIEEYLKEVEDSPVIHYDSNIVNEVFNKNKNINKKSETQGKSNRNSKAKSVNEQKHYLIDSLNINSMESEEERFKNISKQSVANNYSKSKSKLVDDSNKNVQNSNSFSKSKSKSKSKYKSKSKNNLGEKLSKTIVSDSNYLSSNFKEELEIIDSEKNHQNNIDNLKSIGISTIKKLDGNKNNEKVNLNIDNIINEEDIIGFDKEDSNFDKNGNSKSIKPSDNYISTYDDKIKSKYKTNKYERPRYLDEDGILSELRKYIIKKRSKQKISKIENDYIKEYTKKDKKIANMLGVPPPELDTYGNGRYSLRTRIPRGLFTLSFNSNLLKYKKNRFDTWDLEINDQDHLMVEEEIDNKNDKNDKIRHLTQNNKRILHKPFKHSNDVKRNKIDNVFEDLLGDMDTELSCNNDDLLKDVTIDQLEENLSEVHSKSKNKKNYKAKFRINPMCKTPVFRNNNKDLILEIIDSDGFNKIYIENNTFVNSKIGAKFTIKSQEEYIIVNYSSSSLIYEIYTKK